MAHESSAASSEPAVASTQDSRPVYTRRLLGVWVGLVLLLIALQLIPIHSGLLKLAFIIAAVAVWMGAVLLLRRRPVLRWSLVGIPLFSLPFHHKDPFDRPLAASALHAGWHVISADLAFDSYGVTHIW